VRATHGGQRQGRRSRTRFRRFLPWIDDALSSHSPTSETLLSLIQTDCIKLV
jgi:hypothetical protein